MISLNISRFFRRGKRLDEIAESREIKIMHISDTPDNIYPFLLNIIERTKPNYIIHTGDLVDNIKLERKPELKDRYRKSLKSILHILENSGAQVYIVPGNEDDENILKEVAKNSKILFPGSILEIEGLKLALGHEFRDVIKIDADLKLYGHNFKVILKGLNGVLNVNFILLPSRKIVKIKYPDGTNFERGYKMMRGL
ncbi:metallophosphoesterase [Palaeococcus sp. (in: euryarchaeotes)]